MTGNKCLQVPREFVTLENPVATKDAEEVAEGRGEKRERKRDREEEGVKKKKATTSPQ